VSGGLGELKQLPRCRLVKKKLGTVKFIGPRGKLRAAGCAGRILCRRWEAGRADRPFTALAAIGAVGAEYQRGGIWKKNLEESGS